MDGPGPADARRPVPEGRLERPMALGLLQRGDELLASGDFADAAAHYQRVVGFDDAAVTGAALLGLGEARYRLDDEAGAVATWKATLQLPENPATYRAWRNLAAAYVRDGRLGEAIRAYREADTRAPAEDKGEIASRLGWLAKETGDRGASRKYFARARGDGPLVPLAIVVIVATVIVSIAVLFTKEGDSLGLLLQLDKIAVAHGELWRLWTVTLVHADPFHLLFNMYALFLVGPIVERWYGSIIFLVFYLACAAAGSVGSFVFSGDVPSVGASGAIFGLFGVILAANRLHHPVDRMNRGIVSQIGFLIVINLGFGFASGGTIDNAAHIGGLVAGLWLGGVLPPTGVPTMSSFWRGTAKRPVVVGPAAVATRVRTPAFLQALAVGVVAIAVAVGLAIGTGARQDAGTARVGVPSAAWVDLDRRV
jgi:membrane associated rhomboid family serine protease